VDEADLGVLRQALASAGHKLTRPRQAVWRAVASGHLSPAEALEQARAQVPGIGLSTVYRTLRLFVSLGLLRPVYLGEAGQRFARVDDGHHDHLVCDVCGETVELAECPIAPAVAGLAAQLDFQIRGHLVELYGTCPDCTG
jgi:Fur family ferric uptake transcriptional regulator